MTLNCSLESEGGRISKSAVPALREKPDVLGKKVTIRKVPSEVKQNEEWLNTLG